MCDLDLHDASAPRSPSRQILIETNVFADIGVFSLVWLIASLVSVNTTSCISIYSGKMNQS